MFSKKIFLASTSPRRRELFGTLGIPFEVIPPRFEEAPTDLPAAAEALYFSEQKARSVEIDCPNALIIASDTLIDIEGMKLGKPRDAEEAVEMLSRLSGKSHTLYTAVVLLDTESGVLKKQLERVTVTFWPLTRKVIEEYVATGESLGKAGAYAIQEKGQALISKVEGDLQAVVGLPLRVVKEWLKEDEI
ncbi:MAG: septum formation protein Maf [Deltaproteobacteria bacterium]|nr:septum formation protein Maf [Deltaproteobacteria bacterium]